MTDNNSTVTKREKLEGEVRRIVAPKPFPLIIERPDATELKLHIKAISAEDLQTSTDVITKIVHGVLRGMFETIKMGKAMQDQEKFDETALFTAEVVGDLRDKLMAFIPWLIEKGTDTKYDEIKDLGYTVIGDIILEVISFNFGEELINFFSRASVILKPLVGEIQPLGSLAGLISKQSSSTGDTTEKTSGDGALES